SIAAGYIGAGDRVGLCDLAHPGMMIPHRGGRRHLAGLVRTIERTAPPAHGAPRQRPPVLVPGALVYVVASFLDGEAAELALGWRRTGHRVIAVDVLPAPEFDRTTRYDRAAY